MKAFGDIKHIAYVGIDALMLYFKGDTLDEANRVCIRWHRALANYRPLEQEQQSWLVECVPSYDSLLVVFNYQQIDSHGVYRALLDIHQEIEKEKQQEDNCASGGESSSVLRSDTVAIPVWYGAPQASDLLAVSKKTGLTTEEIIALHTSVTYRVYAVGFAPGFAYMGEIPTALQCGRLSTPRKRVPKGAVAIADRQTAVYPSESPGGWNLLGLTPLNMVSHTQQGSTSRLATGTDVTFYAISEEEFRAYNES